MPPHRSRQYIHSRGYTRHALSELMNTPPLEIPLKADPGSPPELKKNWGFVSFSHCADALLIGWSHEPIGVDIERNDRSFSSDKLAIKYFSKEERELLKIYSTKQRKSTILDFWVKKEAAIKWQRGTISKDLSQWSLRKDTKEALHKKFKYKVLVSSINLFKWKVAIASNIQLKNINPIICKA